MKIRNGNTTFAILKEPLPVHKLQDTDYQQPLQKVFANFELRESKYTENVLQVELQQFFKFMQGRGGSIDHVVVLEGKSKAASAYMGAWQCCFPCEREACLISHEATVEELDWCPALEIRARQKDHYYYRLIGL